MRGPLSRVVHVVHVVDARLCLHELLDVDVVKAASAAVAIALPAGSPPSREGGMHRLAAAGLREHGPCPWCLH